VYYDVPYLAIKNKGEDRDLNPEMKLPHTVMGLFRRTNLGKTLSKIHFQKKSFFWRNKTFRELSMCRTSKIIILWHLYFLHFHSKIWLQTCTFTQKSDYKRALSLKNLITNVHFHSKIWLQNSRSSPFSSDIMEKGLRFWKIGDKSANHWIWNGCLKESVLVREMKTWEAKEANRHENESFKRG